MPVFSCKEVESLAGTPVVLPPFPGSSGLHVSEDGSLDTRGGGQGGLGRLCGPGRDTEAVHTAVLVSNIQAVLGLTALSQEIRLKLRVHTAFSLETLSDSPAE